MLLAVLLVRLPVLDPRLGCCSYRRQCMPQYEQRIRLDYLPGPAVTWIVSCSIWRLSSIRATNGRAQLTTMMTAMM